MHDDISEIAMVEGTPLPIKQPDWISCAPFEEFLGMRIDEAADGQAVLTMPLKVEFAEGKASMHRGAVASLAEAAVEIAFKTMLPEGTHFVTTEINVKFGGLVYAGTVKAVAYASKKDERSFIGVADVYIENGIKVATSTSHFKVIRNDNS